MEEKFEKKSGKKIAITMSVILVVLILALVAGVLYLRYTRRPQQIFSKAIEDAFEMSKNEESRAAKIDLEFSLEMESEDQEIQMANAIFKAIQLKSTTEIDLDKKIFNESLKATYSGEEIVGVDALLQDNGMYFYLNEIYSKYIEIPDEYFGGEDLSSIFEINTEVAPEKLVNDVKKVLQDEINPKKFTKENVELDGKKVQKTTLKLTPKEVLEITVKLLEVINEHQLTTELQELIEDLKVEIQYLEETENYMDISIYTKGLTNEIVKAEVILVNVEDDERIAIELIKNSDTEMTINFLINEENLIEVTVKKADEKKGTAKVKLNIDENNSVTVNVKYQFDYNANIEKRDTSNSVNVDELTEEDYQEMYENIEDNVILYSIIEQFMNNEEDYENEYDYEYSY